MRENFERGVGMETKLREGMPVSHREKQVRDI